MGTEDPACKRRLTADTGRGPVPPQSPLIVASASYDSTRQCILHDAEAINSLVS